MATKKVAAAAPAKKGCGCKSAAKKEEITKVAVKPAAKKEAASAAAKPAVKKAVAKVAAPVAQVVKKTVAKNAAPAPKAAVPVKAAPAKAAPVKAAKSVETVFNVYSPASSSVSVAGEFNGWDAEKGAMKKGADGMWNLKVKLAPGSYEYKIVYDGQHWSVDNSNPERVADGQGGENSIKHV